MHSVCARRNSACEQHERSSQNGSVLAHEQISFSESLPSFVICVRRHVKQIPDEFRALPRFEISEVLGRNNSLSIAFRFIFAAPAAGAICESLWHNATAQSAYHQHGRTQTRVTRRRPYRRHGISP